MPSCSHATGGRVMRRAASVCSARKACRRWRSAGFSLASMATANSAALAAPALPIAKLATGMPRGICTMLCSESTPCKWRLGPGDDGFEAAPGGGSGIGPHVVRHAVRRDHAGLMGDAELLKNLHGMPHGVPVAAGAHEHADL